MAVKRRAEAYWVESRQRWQINVQRDNNKRCFTAYTPGRKGKHECEAKADKWLENMNRDQKVENAFELYLQEKSETIAASSLNNTISRVKRIRELLPRKKMLSSLTLGDWQKVLDTFVKEGLSTESVKVFKGTISNFISFCVRNKWELDKIEPEQLIVKAGKPKKEKEAYSLEEIRLLLSPDQDDIPHINLYRLLLFTGFRKNELCAIKWEDVDFESKIINVRRGVDSLNNITTGKTANVLRKVALSSYAENILSDQREKQKKAGIISPYIFAEPSGDHVSYAKINNTFVKLKQRGIAHTIHELRHTFVSLTDKELSLAILKKSIGHSAAMSTQKTYSHTTLSDIEEMRKGVEKAFENII